MTAEIIQSREQRERSWVKPSGLMTGAAGAMGATVLGSLLSWSSLSWFSLARRSSAARSASLLLCSSCWARALDAGLATGFREVDGIVARSAIWVGEETMAAAVPITRCARRSDPSGVCKLGFCGRPGRVGVCAGPWAFFYSALVTGATT